MKLPFNDLIKQAQDLQSKMAKMQQDLASVEAVGESGAGLVRVTMNGQYAVRRVQIDPTVISEEREVLEDLVAAACNDAVRRIERARQEHMGSLTDGLPLPPGFKFPFGT